MCECLDYDDGTRHTCEACVNDLELMRRAMNAADARAEKAEAALAEERERRIKADADADTFIDAVSDDLGNVIYNIETGNRREAEEQANEIRGRIDDWLNARENAALRAAPAQPQPLGPVDLAALPVHFVSVLPRGHVFMHPDTPKGGVRDPFGPFPPPPEKSR